MSLRHTHSRTGGFEIHTLSNDALSLSIAPELGGRLVSLKDNNSGREWLDGWSPAGKRRIWQPTDPANFETGPGAGVDECFPTVLPCRIGRKSYPDHGDLWNRAPEFDRELAVRGVFRCFWKPGSVPVTFERRISIRGDKMLIDYRLENLADRNTPFLWAWHPLFTWKPGDQIRFPKSTATCLTGGGDSLPWPEISPGTDLSKAAFPKGATPAAKVFIAPKSKGVAEIHANSGSTLRLTWPAELFPYAGIWITRGFWKGLHHWAVEPTNAPVDCLSDIRNGTEPSPTQLGPGEVRNWRIAVRLRVESR